MAVLKTYNERPNFSRLSGDKFVDVALEFKRHPVTSDVTAKTGLSAISQAIRNICLTNPGDIDEEPEFGVGASSYLGENMNPVDIMSLKERIQTQCTRYEPRAEVTSVLVNADYEGHTLSLRITYTPVNVDTEETLTIEVTRVL